MQKNITISATNTAGAPSLFDTTTHDIPTWYRGDAVQFTFAFPTTPATTPTKLRVFAKRLKNGFACDPTSEPIFSKDKTLSGSPIDYSIGFTTEEMSLASGMFFLTAALLDSSDNLITALAGVVHIAESGVNDSYEPPSTTNIKIKNGYFYVKLDNETNPALPWHKLHFAWKLGVIQPIVDSQGEA